MADYANIEGGAELDRLLQSLPLKIEKNILRAALRAGAAVVRDEARANLVANGSVDSGLLAKGVRVTGRVKAGTVYASVKVGGRHNFLAQWIEFGVKPHGVKKGARLRDGKYQDGKLHPGFGEKPFLRPAVDKKSGQVISAVTSKIRERLTTELINVPAPEVP